MEFSRRRLSQKGTEGTTVIPPPRGGPRDHGRGYPRPSHLRLWLDLETNGRRNQGEENGHQTREMERRGRRNPGDGHLRDHFRTTNRVLRNHCRSGLQALVQLMENGAYSNFLYKDQVEDSRFMVQRRRFSVSHVPREANTCADALVNMGANQTRELVALRDSPIEFSSLLMTDTIKFVSKKM
ncbi:hypothetical protein Acr_18g0003610 [Actinidia rufa]|uniref:RNase H type-1 domain-containing protein n=1 Tax=Actinidia rufa TaxID=165716 RepID=A0A7J0G5Y1_9ERIC|nr:hypothetical protein Acr_18g0003610 [Actinidia rufa]